MSLQLSINPGSLQGNEERSREKRLYYSDNNNNEDISANIKKLFIIIIPRLIYEIEIVMF